MTKPNRTLHYMPKRPFDLVKDRLMFSHEAEHLAADLKAQGYEVRVTHVRERWRGVNRVIYRVWKRGPAKGVTQ